MTVMAVLLGVLFIGLTVVSVAFGLRPTEPGGLDRGDRGGGHIRRRVTAGSVFAASTALNLFLAANTSFDAFPRHWLRSWPMTVTCRASSRSVATGSRVRGASPSSRRSRSGAALGVRRRHPCAYPALLGRCLPSCFTLSQAGMVLPWLSAGVVGLAVAAVG